MKHAGAKFGELPAASISRQVLHATKSLSLILASGQENESPTFATERAKLAGELYQNRRDRDRLFDADLFSDPAWDILLILYCASHAQQRISVSSVCIAAAVPETTAIRWIGLLCRLEFVGKAKSPTDGRVTWLFILEEARQRLDRYFDRIIDKQDLAPQPLPFVVSSGVVRT